MDVRIMNGKPKVTAIVSFDRSVKLIRPDLLTVGFKSLVEMRKYVDRQGFEINVAHIHPANGEGRVIKG